MLLVGCAKTKFLAEKLDGQVFHNVKFNVTKMEGLSLWIDHNAPDDRSAKGIVKEIVKTIPDLNGFYVNIQIIDEVGRIQ